MLKNLPTDLDYVQYPYRCRFISCDTFDETSEKFAENFFYLTMLGFFEDLRLLV